MDSCSFCSALALGMCKCCLLLHLDAGKHENMLLKLESEDEDVAAVQAEFDRRITRHAELLGDHQMNEGDSKRTISAELESYLERAKLRVVGGNNTQQQQGVCPSCHDYLIPGMFCHLAKAAKLQLQKDALLGRPVTVEVQVPESIRALRICCRVAVTGTYTKERGFAQGMPPLEDVVKRLFCKEMAKSRHGATAMPPIKCCDADVTNAVQIDICLKFHRSPEMLYTLFPAFVPKGAARSNIYFMRCARAFLKRQLGLNGGDSSEGRSTAAADINLQLRSMWDGCSNSDEEWAQDPLFTHIQTKLSKQNLHPCDFQSDDTTLDWDMAAHESSVVLANMRSYSATALKEIRTNLVHYQNFFSISANAALPYDAWSLSITPRPLYLFGRYRKLARDVPQTPWLGGSVLGGSRVGFTATPAEASSSSSSSAPNDESGNKRKREDVICASGTEESEVAGAKADGDTNTLRKGRYSVEEFISEAVQFVLGATSCRMHACGREDIDVRCLGNGRPFCMQVSGAKTVPTEALLQQAVAFVSQRQGLNVDGDVDLVLLREADRTVWEGMQKAAEEKDKGYACVVWTANAITKADLARFHQQCVSQNGTNSSNNSSRSSSSSSSATNNVLEIKQKTPLRVLHRRSQLTRTRHISNVETVLLGPHFFLLRLQTSAGTYVKEWVHGDLGRTSPSLSSILGTQADILQLDVVRLFDVYEGGGAGEHSDGITSYNSASWNRLGNMRIPGVSSNSNKHMSKSQ